MIKGMTTDWDHKYPALFDLYKLQKVKCSDLASMLEAYDGHILRDGIKYIPIFHNGGFHRLNYNPDNAVWISYRSYKFYHIALIKFTSYIFEESSNENNDTAGKA